MQKQSAGPNRGLGGIIRRLAEGGVSPQAAHAMAKVRQSSLSFDDLLAGIAKNGPVSAASKLNPVARRELAALGADAGVSRFAFPTTNNATRIPSKVLAREQGLSYLDKARGAQGPTPYLESLAKRKELFPRTQYGPPYPGKSPDDWRGALKDVVGKNPAAKHVMHHDVNDGPIGLHPQLPVGSSPPYKPTVGDKMREISRARPIQTGAAIAATAAAPVYAAASLFNGQKPTGAAPRVPTGPTPQALPAAVADASAPAALPDKHSLPSLPDLPERVGPPELGLPAYEYDSRAPAQLPDKHSLPSLEALPETSYNLPAPKSPFTKSESPGWLSTAIKYAPHAALAGLGGLGAYHLYNQLKGKNQDEEQDFSKLGEFVESHPLVAGFLSACHEAGLDDQQITEKIAAACQADPAIAREFSAAMQKSALLDEAMAPVMTPPKLGPAAGKPLAVPPVNAKPPAAPTANPYLNPKPNLPKLPPNRYGPQGSGVWNGFIQELNRNYNPFSEAWNLPTVDTTDAVLKHTGRAFMGGGAALGALAGLLAGSGAAGAGAIGGMVVGTVPAAIRTGAKWLGAGAYGASPLAPLAFSGNSQPTPEVPAATPKAFTIDDVPAELQPQIQSTVADQVDRAIATGTIPGGAQNRDKLIAELTSDKIRNAINDGQIPVPGRLNRGLDPVGETAATPSGNASVPPENASQGGGAPPVPSAEVAGQPQAPASPAAQAPAPDAPIEQWQQYTDKLIDDPSTPANEKIQAMKPFVEQVAKSNGATPQQMVDFLAQVEKDGLPPEKVQQAFQKFQAQRLTTAQSKAPARLGGPDAPPVPPNGVVDGGQSNLMLDLQTQGAEAWDTFSKMDPVTQSLIGLGFGVGAIGLMHMLSNGGSMSGALMSLLGFGAAAGIAGHGGMFGQDVQNGIQGAMGDVKSLLAGPGQQPAGPDVPPVPPNDLGSQPTDPSSQQAASPANDPIAALASQPYEQRLSSLGLDGNDKVQNLRKLSDQYSPEQLTKLLSGVPVEKAQEILTQLKHPLANTGLGVGPDAHRELTDVLNRYIANPQPSQSSMIRQPKLDAYQYLRSGQNPNIPA